MNPTNNAKYAARRTFRHIILARAHRLIAREVREVKGQFTWYDMTFFGLLIVAVFAITGGLLR